MVTKYIICGYCETKNDYSDNASCIACGGPLDDNVGAPNKFVQLELSSEQYKAATDLFGKEFIDRWLEEAKDKLRL